MDTDPRLKESRAALTLAALGIVYGDIGTSPLYAVKETFASGHGIPLQSSTILRGISAILWALMLVVSLKYVVLIMRAHNKGEGGIMALLALASSACKNRPRQYAAVLFAGLTGAALFYGDAVLTLAISVLSAVEGLETCRHSNACLYRGAQPVRSRQVPRDGPRSASTEPRLTRKWCASWN